jgi:hypothetical protein
MTDRSTAPPHDNCEKGRILRDWFKTPYTRPQMANLDRDYPDRSTKPIEGPYRPSADDFPIEQHRVGPFPPIEQYYKSLKP